MLKLRVVKNWTTQEKSMVRFRVYILIVFPYRTFKVALINAIAFVVLKILYKLVFMQKFLFANIHFYK